MKALLLYIFVCFFFISEVLIFSARLDAQQLHLKLYTVNDGLPTTQTYLPYQDKYGYLWIGGSAGLSRFDGKQFINYSLADGLPSLNATVVFQDSYERLWIGTDVGMAQFKNNRFVTYNVSDSMQDIYVLNFKETKNRKLWALTTKGIYEFEGTIWKKISLYPSFENNVCRNIIETKDELYVNYASDIFCRNKNRKWIHIASKNDYVSIFNVMSVQDGNIMVSTDKNIYTIRGYQLVPVLDKNVPCKYFFTYLVDDEKRLWIAGDNLLEISKPNDWKHFPASVDLKNYSAYINVDSSNNVWIGTSGGLLKQRDISFTIIDKNKNAPLNGIFNMIALPDNRIIFSSEKGLLLYENNCCQQILPPLSPGNEKYYQDPVDAYTFDNKNTLWIATRFRRLQHFDGHTLTDFSDILHLTTTEDIYDMKYIQSRKQVFICGSSTLLYGTFSKLSTFIPHNTGVPIIRPTRLCAVKNGLLLLYIDGQGVFCIDKNDNLISLIKQTKIDGSKKSFGLNVNFYEDKAGNFWIAFPGMGLYEYGFANDKMPFLKDRITTNEGLQSNDILSLIGDRYNRIWLAANTGIDILQLNKRGTWEVFNFIRDEEVGLDENIKEKIVSDTTGNIFLSTPDKIIKFDIKDIHLHKETPQIIIEKVSLEFKETDWNKLADSLYSYFELPYKPVLKYNQNSLGISFNAIDLSAPNFSPDFSYKLLPVDTTWSIPGKEKSVSFAQLPAGKYRFFVRAKDRASGWSKPAVFLFSISSPFWDRWWFRLIVIAIASYIIIAIVRARVKKARQESMIENQLKELEMKALKAQMNPHFIYNALNSIQSLIANDKKDEGIYYIGSFSRLLRQVLDNSENSVISLDKELESIGLYIRLEELRLGMQLQYKKMIAQNIVTEFEKIPPLILQPFVENALWHGLSSKEGEKEIIITVNANDNWLVCEIIDNGIGRVKAEERKSRVPNLHLSKALDITRKRLIDFNETDRVAPIEFFDLYDDDTNPLGTNVTVRIKRKNIF